MIGNQAQLSGPKKAQIQAVLFIDRAALRRRLHLLEQLHPGPARMLPMDRAALKRRLRLHLLELLRPGQARVLPMTWTTTSSTKRMRSGRRSRGLSGRGIPRVVAGRREWSRTATVIPAMPAGPSSRMREQATEAGVDSSMIRQREIFRHCIIVVNASDGEGESGHCRECVPSVNENANGVLGRSRGSLPRLQIIQE